VPALRTGPVIGWITQVVVLAGLASTVGLGSAGWLAGIAYGAVVGAVLNWGLHQCGADDLGPADWVTLARSVLVGGVTALTVDSFSRPAPVTVLVTLAIVALALDAVDGQVARRTGTVSAFGARFDMEVDSALLIVISVYVTHHSGGWALAIGGMRYAFVLGTWVLPWMRETLPPRYWRKVVAAVQGIVLVVAMAGALPQPVVAAALSVALGLLIESFGRDVLWLWHRRPVRRLVLVGSGRLHWEPRRGEEMRT
jgi:phosphatidylglycerophosphate synthase